MTTIGQILVNENLPPKYRDYNRTLGADEIEDILATIAKEDPSLYSDVSGKLMRLGTEAAYESGATLRLSDIRPIIDKSKHLAFLDAQEAKIRSAKNLTPKQREELIDDLYNSVNSVIEKETYATGVSKANPFAMQVKSKARGTPGQFASIVSTPGIYKDSNGKTVQTFIRNSYAEGLTPAELWAGSYGARTGVVSTKFATAKGGAFGKKVSSICIDQVVTEDDCGAPYGFPVKASDKDNIGCVLQQDAGGYTAGTVITKSVFADLQKKNLDEILVRSPVTCSCKDGICSKCAGIRETGKFPEIGYSIGLNAGSALGERIAQGSLNCLAEGTLVRMADGSTKPIEKVEPGELVLGSDLNGNISPTKVVARYDNGIQPCVSTRFIENGTDNSTNTGVILESTIIHKILGIQVDTEQPEEKLNRIPRMLEVGCESPEFYACVVHSMHSTTTLEAKEHISKSENCSMIAFKRVEQKDIGLRHVYDLEVECKDHIYLLANGLIVHNTKHTGRKIEGASRFSGFEMLKAMADVPKQYPDKAILSDIDGKVTKIVAAPQGGNYIYVNDQRHYVPQGYDLMVKEGDELEAGDQMSDGVINTAEVVKYKGIGEGRRYFTNRFTQAFRDSGYKANRRNIEVLARSLVDHVEINDPEAEGQFLPGDVATYSQWSFGYKPRPTAVRDQPGKLIGSYLEEPVLHYTVGSRVTKKMIDDLKKFKVDKILADKQPIEVTPVMKSITEGPAHKGDWVGRLGTTYIKQRLVEDAQYGAESNIHSTNPLPGIAKGVEFGNYGEPGVNRPGGFTY